MPVMKEEEEVSWVPVSTPESPSSRSSKGSGRSHKKILYFVRHAEAEHNVKERLAVQAAIASGAVEKEKQELARKTILREDQSLKDARLSEEGTLQARTSGQKLEQLFSTKEASVSGSPMSSSKGSSGIISHSSQSFSSMPFRRPEVVLVSPLRRALMTATEFFYKTTQEGQDPPFFLAIEALREKRTGFVCDERHSVAELRTEFPHVDFSDVERGLPCVPVGEDNAAVRARVATFLDERLAHIPGEALAIVSHKGWLRELRKTLKERVQSGQLQADFDVAAWDTTLYGNAEVRVAAFRWGPDGALMNIVSRSVDRALNATMMGDGFEFALGPPHTGFSIFLADRTTKVHFISLAEGRHHVALREAQDADICLLRAPDKAASDHPLFDARLTAKGARQAEKLRDMLANRPSGGRPFTAFDLVIVSPLTRACETAEIVFGKTPGEYGGIAMPPPRVLVREECRERYGRYVCDGRRTRVELQREFPSFDFSELPCDEDVFYTDERETAVEVQARALRLLEWLSARPERCVAVVTHAEFLRHLFGQFGDTLDEKDRSSLQRMNTAHCELRSVVLCSHGKVERQDAPPSTIRVPSSSSMNSLTALGP